MFSGIRKEHIFDLMIFNPPYLPTSEEEKVPGWLNYAFDGGVDGRASLRPFLKKPAVTLHREGRYLLLVSSLTGIGEIRIGWKDTDS